MFLMLYGYNDVAVTLPIWSNLDITLPFDVYINMINEVVNRATSQRWQK